MSETNGVSDTISAPTINSSYGEDTLAHDAAGNLIWDGVYKYTYDAWNRLVKVEKAYRDPDSSGALTAAYTVTTMQYDALHRRIVKAVQNSADLDCTYHYYYDNQWRILEERNGSDQVIRQNVWGQMYIDELVQTGLNTNPTLDDDVDTFYFASHDANFNVLGIVDETGTLTERYEYTPYGQRTVYFSPGVNDPRAHAATTMSRRVTISSFDQPYGLNPFGHQSLMHDEESGLVPNRHRMLHPKAARFMQRDPLGYVDGMSVYQYVRSSPFGRVDPTGLVDWWLALDGTFEVALGALELAWGGAFIAAPEPTMVSVVAGGYLVTDGTMRVGSGGATLLIAFFGDEQFLERAEDIPHGIDGTVGLVARIGAEQGGASKEEAKAWGATVGTTMSLLTPSPPVPRSRSLRLAVEVTADIDGLKQAHDNVSLSLTLLMDDPAQPHTNVPAQGSVTFSGKQDVGVTLICPDGFIKYDVKDGDTLWGIWTRRQNKQVSLSEMMRANDFLADPGFIKPGWKVCAPECVTNQ